MKHASEVTMFASVCLITLHVFMSLCSRQLRTFEDMTFSSDESGCGFSDI